MTKRLTNREKEKMIERVRLHIKRRHGMATMPLKTSEEGYDLWLRCLDPEIADSVKKVAGSNVSGVLYGDHYIRLKIEGYSLKLGSNKNIWHTPKGGLQVPDNDPMYPMLTEYAKDIYRITKEGENTLDVVNSLIMNATAAGQIKRVWPELTSFLGIAAAESLKSVQRASRVPTGFNLENFKENKALYDTVLAQAFMLPEPELYNITIHVRQK